MTRQCLYCTKELPKNSASNFCSKECWTEYKKLKAMNVDSDKQATVMLKRSDIPSPSVEAPRNNTPPSASESSPDMLQRLEALEKLFQEKAFESESRAEPTPQATPIVDPSMIDDFNSRLQKLETELHAMEDQIRFLNKLTDRINALETKTRSQTPEPPARKKGFFARLFG